MGALDGIRVLDLTSMVSGPMATMILADQGADVIKVEPLAGELMRFIGHAHNDVAAGFYSCNRGKRSIAVDLKSESGCEVLRRLISTADVLIQNFRPGAIDRMGFGEPAVRAMKPDIVFVSVSGFGEEGPYAHQRVYDPVIQALSGATDIQADRSTGRPQMFRVIVADKVTALTASQAVVSALFARERTGQGQHVRLSMLDAMVAFFWPEGMAGLVYADREVDVTKYQGTMDLIYRTRDGYITAGAVSDSEWQGMCQALGREELIDDPRFATARARFAHAEERKRITAAEIEKWRQEEILARLDAENVPCAPLLKRTELIEHEQLVTNGTIDRTRHDGFGEVRQARPAARFETTPSAIQGPAPKLGQHTGEILSELGFTLDEQQALEGAGSIRC